MRTKLVLAEKPDAALHIAEALQPDGRPKKSSVRGVPVYEVQLPSERIIVCSALGHLYKVDQVGNARSRQYPVWDYEWKPIHLAEQGRDRQARWLKAIAEIAWQVDDFVNACDLDVEGSLIGYMILKHACHEADKSAKRMKFSALTTEELRHAYEHASPQLDFPLVNAGLCRHEVDWLYGINLSRALTETARKSSGRYATLSTGRVQGPTLRFVVEREQRIESFVPIPYWEIEARVEIDGERLQAQYEKERFETKKAAEEAASTADGKEGVVDEIATKTAQIPPPFPFDLSTLQAEAYRHFGMTPRTSLGTAERLYLDALISYPRTSSQKLPPSIGYRRVLEQLSCNPTYKEHANALMRLASPRPNEGKKTDPAHPAVYPTGVLPKKRLELGESRLYDVIVKRFMATFAGPAIRETIKATVKISNAKFYLRGSQITEAGWISFYKPYTKFERVDLPPLKEGMSAKFTSVRAIEKFTQPPPRYNASSLLREMETNEIGTKATRADIVETLHRRAYVRGERIEATPLGTQIVEVLQEYCPKVLDVQFTRELEEMMTRIELGKEEKDEVVSQVVSHLKPIMDELKAHENNIGGKISLTIRQMRSREATLSSSCPKCGRKLVVVRSKRSGKRFIGCLGKWDGACTFTLPLPQFGVLTLLDRKCTKCGFQLVSVSTTDKRPFVTCPMCYVDKSQ